jgi:hypothetical protein
MSQDQRPAEAGWGCRTLGCLLTGLGLAFFFLLMMSGIGTGLIELGWALLFGWTGFISRVIPKITWNWGAYRHRRRARRTSCYFRAPFSHVVNSWDGTRARRIPSMAMEVDLLQLAAANLLPPRRYVGGRRRAPDRLDLGQQGILI